MRKQTFDYQLLDNADATTTQTTAVSNINSADKLSYHIKFSTNNSGTFDVQVRNNEADDWASLNFGSPLTMTADNEALFLLSEVPFHQIRLVWTPSSGAGTMDCWIKSKSVGA